MKLILSILILAMPGMTFADEQQEKNLLGDKVKKSELTIATVSALKNQLPLDKCYDLDVISIGGEQKRPGRLLNPAKSFKVKIECEKQSEYGTTVTIEGWFDQNLRIEITHFSFDTVG